VQALISIVVRPLMFLREKIQGYNKHLIYFNGKVFIYIKLI